MQNISFIIILLIHSYFYTFSKDTLQISFQSKKNVLKGKLLVSKESGKKVPAIIFLVGSGVSSYNSNYKDFIQFFLEKPFENRNIALMYFDKPGIGQSQGAWYRQTFAERALDVKHAAEYLKSLDFIDPEKIFLVGHSQGGWIVQFCLAEYPQLFAGGVSMAGATFGVKKQLMNDFQEKFICKKKISGNKAHKKAKNKVNKILFFTHVFPIKQGWKHLKRIKRFEASPYLAKIKQPFLLMWGQNDPLVSDEWCLNDLKIIFPLGIPQNFEAYVGIGENHSFKTSELCHKGKTSHIPYSETSKSFMINWLKARF